MVKIEKTISEKKYTLGASIGIKDASFAIIADAVKHHGNDPLLISSSQTEMKELHLVGSLFREDVLGAAQRGFSLLDCSF